MTTNRSSSTTQEHPLAQAGKDAGESAGHLAERAADLGMKRTDQTKDQMAHGLEQLAGSIRDASGQMRSEQPAMASAVSTAADQTERIATYLRDTDAREMIGTVEDVARRQPLLFIGGAFLIGVAASRFLKAGGGGSTNGHGRSPASDGRSAYGYAGTGVSGGRTPAGLAGSTGPRSEGL